MSNRDIVSISKLEAVISGRDIPTTTPMDAAAQVQRFGDLPTEEIDKLLDRLEQQREEIIKAAQAIKDVYAKHTERLKADIAQLQEKGDLTKKMLDGLLASMVKIENGEGQS